MIRDQPPSLSPSGSALLGSKTVQVHLNRPVEAARHLAPARASLRLETGRRVPGHCGAGFTGPGGAQVRVYSTWESRSEKRLLVVESYGGMEAAARPT